jgi:hypothetical protein
MARKISGGLVGQPSVGAINVAPTAVMTAAADQNITISPVGDAAVLVTNNMQLNAQNDLRFADADSSNWVAFQGATSIGSNVTWTLPSTDGSSNQILTTNGAGTLSWTAKSFTLSTNTIDSSPNFIVFTTTTSGDVTDARISNTGLSFQPSTGTLTCTALEAGSITETSSITLKENFRPIEDALDKVLRLTGLIYDRKDGSQKDEVGLIAEDVNQIIPNIVGKNAEGKPSNIAYQRLAIYLIESVKTLHKEIKEIRGV